MTRPDDGSDETIEADPELMASLRDKAQQQQAAQRGPSPIDNTEAANPELMAQLRESAHESQAASAEVRSDHATPANNEAPRSPANEFAERENERVHDAAERGAPEDFGATTTLHSQTYSDGSAAKRFVRSARESREPTAGERVTRSAAPRRRRSGVVVLAAAVLGVQVIAAATYFTLKALQVDDDPVDEVAAQTTGASDLEDLVPTEVPANATAAPLAATPTPVPPTPQWLPANQGPRANPFGFVVEAIVAKPRFFDGPEGNSIVPENDGQEIELENPLRSGEPMVLRVVQGEPGDPWAVARIPGAQAPVWIDTQDFVWRSTNTAIQVDLATNRIRLFEGNELLHEGEVESGTLATPTSPLSSWITEAPRPAADLSEREPFLLLATADGATDTLLGIGLVDGFIEGDGYVTDGAVRVLPDTARQVEDYIVAGSIVEFIGVPPRPTPTAVPTATVNPEALQPAAPLNQPSRLQGEGAQGRGCPSGQRGTPPNCYKVVDRPVVKGMCESWQVEIDDSCLILGGSPKSEGCPSAAPEMIQGFCYVRIGAVPKVPGDCPPQTTQVGDECHSEPN